MSVILLVYAKIHLKCLKIVFTFINKNRSNVDHTLLSKCRLASKLILII